LEEKSVAVERAMGTIRILRPQVTVAETALRITALKSPALSPLRPTAHLWPPRSWIAEKSSR